MREIKGAHYDLKNRDEARAYMKIASEKYEKDRDFDAFLEVLREVVDAQGESEKNRKAQANPVTLGQMRILRRMGLFGEVSTGKKE